MIRSYSIWASLLTGAIAAQVAAAPEGDLALQRGVDWLVEQQHADGSWRSTTYGQMHSGVANTALAIRAISALPQRSRAAHATSIERGVKFLLTRIDSDGYLAAENHAEDYPAYATALLLDAIERLRPDQWHRERRQMRSYLLRIQRRGATSDVRYGGWPQIGGNPADAAVEANVNISASRFAMQALARSGGMPLEARRAALTFLDRCRNADDGGYFFTPVVDDPLNKAGRTPAGRPRSYGTATADAVLTLAACEVPRDDERLRSAIHWLQSQASIHVVPGWPNDDSSIAGSDTALTFYYWAALAQVIARFPDSSLNAHREELRLMIVRGQRPDGSWANPCPLMHEDDPLIATPLAVIALTLCH